MCKSWGSMLTHVIKHGRSQASLKGTFLYQAGTAEQAQLRKERRKNLAQEGKVKPRVKKEKEARQGEEGAQEEGEERAGKSTNACDKEVQTDLDGAAIDRLLLLAAKTGAGTMPSPAPAAAGERRPRCCSHRRLPWAARR